MRPRHGAVVVSIAVVAGLGLTACTSEPSLNEIGPKFEQDANEVFEELIDSYSANTDAAEITNDGSENIPCDDGARREFDATFPMMEGDPESNLEIFTRAVVVSFENNHGYTMVGDDYHSGTERTYRATNEDETITFEVHATGEPNSEVTFTGKTTCAST
ncbi:hypothetical protein CLV30_11353 [Haloactinopolyspora alba]|uniref:Uncharacterized protein n=2 Tax=Haloactinopolyspora alba TaxID=648780 RepID=A0A2P8DWG6_9ACTN|nr:hypothetical protein CLV30_11353 [Haloactinopolyspora alba]